MPELKSELSWSVSRAKMLRECPRRYYYHYYQSWEGWKPDAPPDRKKAYQLKLMVNLDMLAGQVVHEVIRDMFMRDRETLTPVTSEQARKLALTRMRDAWRESRDRMWTRSPKRFTNLFEHYYDEEIPESRTDEIRDRVERCLANFFASDTLRSIRAAGAKCWLRVDELDFFEFAGVKVYAVPDFALRDGPVIHIYDWKTGKSDENVEDQLACYTLFAVERWKVQPNRVIPSAVYLRDNYAEQIDVKEERLSRTKDHIRASLSEMIRLLRSVEHNIPRDMEAFSQTQRVAHCSRCFFKEFCAPRPG